MQTKAKANSIVTSSYDEGRNVITFSVLDVGDVELDLNKVHEANMRRAAIHGWNQRIPDAAAIGVTDKDGNVIPKAERNRIKYERMNELCAHYESGTEEWNRRASGEGNGGKSLTLEAIARWKGISYEEAEALVEKHAEIHKMDKKAALAFFRTGTKTKAAMQEIRDERATKSAPKVDPDAMLEEMNAE